MSFRLVQKSVTLNDLDMRKGRVVCVNSSNSLAFGTYYVKVVELTPIHSVSDSFPTITSAYKFSYILFS